MLGSTRLFFMMLLRMCLVSVIGMLEYMFEISSEVNAQEAQNEASFRFCIKCEEFFMLKGHGRGISLFSV
jgi:hypothetical protein